MGSLVPLPGCGSTLRRWEFLASVGALDLSLARVLEPHLDALAILGEAAVVPAPQATWGVYAAEGPGTRLEAIQTRRGESWRLTGHKPWCSLAGRVSHALVTAWVGEGARGLFAVDLRDPGVVIEDGAWTPTGLVDIVTTSLVLEGVPALPVGRPGWYLDRAGFGWGGMGVAAVWYGGAVGLARRLFTQLGHREPDQIALMHLGVVDAGLGAARAVLASAAAEVDGGRAAGADGAVLAARVRQVVVDASEMVMQSVAHALGPAPLSQEPEHARRVADLALYVRQHHAERDQATLGRLVLDLQPDGEPPW
ncbi:MAG: acyl-CoA dehydrogenase [Nocardioides sp.]